MTLPWYQNGTTVQPPKFRTARRHPFFIYQTSRKIYIIFPYFVYPMKPRSNPESPSEIRKKLPIKQEFIEMIRYDGKTIDIRIAYPDYDDISVGDHIRLRSSRDEVIIKVKAIRRHRSISEVMRREKMSKIAPQVPLIHLRELARGLFKKSHIEQYGLLAIEFEVIES